VAARWILVVSLFFLFTDDAVTLYADKWSGLFGWTHVIFFADIPYKIRPFDHILVLCMFLEARKAGGVKTQVPQMRAALLLCAATTVVWFAFGLAHGGDFRAACWQIYLMLSGVFFAFCISAIFRTPQHYAMLAKMLLAAAAYRAVMCWSFYFAYVRPNIIPLPGHITSHDDSVLWVVAMLILILRFIETPKIVERIKITLFLLLLAGAIQFNTRRLAWVSLAMGIAVLVALLPPGKAKRRVTRWTLMAAPLLLLYVVVGWGREERIFKPLSAFASVSTQEDASTKARNVENLGLIATANASGRYMGTGWGHKYIELSSKYSIADLFELWPYVPHNSILGLLAYTGILGFCGYWLVFPTAMFFNARLAKTAQSQPAHQVALIGAAQMIVCANQFYGDMGIFSYKVTYILFGSYAIALRLPLSEGALTAPTRSATQRAAARSAVADMPPKAARTGARA
jgi:hypothetical protein